MNKWQTERNLNLNWFIYLRNASTIGWVWVVSSRGHRKVLEEMSPVHGTLDPHPLLGKSQSLHQSLVHAALHLGLPNIWRKHGSWDVISQVVFSTFIPWTAAHCQTFILYWRQRTFSSRPVGNPFSNWWETICCSLIQQRDESSLFWGHNAF